jgi:heme ABC exporter ATP-binding subunit CcmA
LNADSAIEVATPGRAARPAPGSGPALEVAGLVRRLGEREVLRGIDARLEAGETLAVFGPNGAGKTTFLRVLATLLVPHRGSVRVLGSELPREAHLLRSRIGLVGHEPLLYRDLTGRENLAFYARLYAVQHPEQRIEELLAAVDMSLRADEPISQLSRGMIQRLSVARAVLHRPELLLLDEPRAWLDPDAEQLTEALVGRGAGRARVLVTHDVERGLREADRVLGLHGGRVLLAGPAQAIEPGSVHALYRAGSFEHPGHPAP